jgi:hypothetical protein
MSERYPRLSNVSGKYGAPMGRPNQDADDRTLPIKFHLTRMRWVDGDYDAGGAYWGNSGGTSIYQAEGDCEEEGIVVEVYYRAATREDAKAKVLKDYPKARFWR